MATILVELALAAIPALIVVSVVTAFMALLIAAWVGPSLLGIGGRPPGLGGDTVPLIAPDLKYGGELPEYDNP